MTPCVEKEVFMKTWKLFWVLVFVGVMSSGFLTACGKGGDSSGHNSLSYGSVSSDGTNVTSSNTSIAGIPVSLSITNITRGYYGGGCCGGWNGGYNGGYGGQSVSFTLSINGQSSQLQATTAESGFNTQIANFYADTAMACYDSSCNTVLLAVIIAGSGYNSYGNYECKEIAIRKNMTNNAVEAVREFQGACTVGPMVPVSQLVNQM